MNTHKVKSRRSSLWMIGYSSLQIIASVLLLIAGILFYYFNAQAISNLWLVILFGMSIITLISGYNLYCAISDFKKILKNEEIKFESRFKILNLINSSIVTAIIHIALGIGIIVLFLESVLFGYFQPLSLYDFLIIFVAGSWGLYSIMLFISSINFLIKKLEFRKCWKFLKLSEKKPQILSGLTKSSLLLILIIPGVLLSPVVNNPKMNTGLENVIDLFESGEAGYKTFRIPGMIILPNGATLNDSSTLGDDVILAFAEARKNGDLDTGVIDLVMKRSADGGDTWSDLVILQTWPNEKDTVKFGNPTPVFDEVTGMIFLPYLRQGVPNESTATFIMNSTDGGINWSSPYEIKKGALGPGHSIQLKYGPDAGRLIIPCYGSDGAYSFYSDDHGVNWIAGSPIPDKEGNECEMVELVNGTLYMSLRTRIPVASLHGPLNRLYSLSYDGGETWTAAEEEDAIPTPICMASIVRHSDTFTGTGNRIVFSNPASQVTRAHMTVRLSTDEGQTWSVEKEIYAGPSGYSDLAVDSNYVISLLFENGRIEYSAKITFVQFDIDWLLA